MLLVALAACAAAPVPVAPPPAPSPPVWPQAGAPLVRLDDPLHPRAQPLKVLVDPGHGAPGNEGNTGVNCQKEAVEALRIAAPLVARLAAAPEAFSVRATREGDALVEYAERVAQADAWADVLVSLHTDARKSPNWRVDAATGCQTTDGAHGFSVLWSDEGEPALVAERQRLAHVTAEALLRAGFPAYGGEDYTGLYAGDPLHPGTFVDRHEPDQRVRLLRRPRVPSIIVETHNAPDAAEVARWSEPATLEVFADAVRVALDRYAAGE